MLFTFMLNASYTINTCFNFNNILSDNLKMGCNCKMQCRYMQLSKIKRVNFLTDFSVFGMLKWTTKFVNLFYFLFKFLQILIINTFARFLRWSFPCPNFLDHMENNLIVASRRKCQHTNYIENQPFEALENHRNW